MRTLTIQSIANIRNDIIEIQDGTIEGKAACRVVFGGQFTTEEVLKFKKYKSVVAIGTAQYRYAPEIKHSYIVVKGGK